MVFVTILYDIIGVGPNADRQEMKEACKKKKKSH